MTLVRRAISGGWLSCACPGISYLLITCGGDACWSTIICDGLIFRFPTCGYLLLSIITSVIEFFMIRFYFPIVMWRFDLSF